MPGGSPGANPTSPQRDSFGGKNGGPGNVDAKQLKQMVEGWGKLPEKEQAQRIQELTREMPAKHREVIQNYFRDLAKASKDK
jgi:hypothetical protein